MLFCPVYVLPEMHNNKSSISSINLRPQGRIASVAWKANFVTRGFRHSCVVSKYSSIQVLFNIRELLRPCQYKTTLICVYSFESYPVWRNHYKEIIQVQQGSSLDTETAEKQVSVGIVRFVYGKSTYCEFWLATEFLQQWSVELHLNFFGVIKLTDFRTKAA